SPGELIELERRIDELRVHTHGTGLIAIDRWLANSRSAIRARAVAEQKNSVWLHEAFAIGQPECGERRLECKRCRGSRLQQVRSRQCQGFPRNPGRFHPGSGLSPSL